jgi:hypothetical protein
LRPTRRTASSTCTTPCQGHDGVGSGLLDDRSGGRGVVEVGLDEADALGRGTRQAAARRDDAVDVSLRLFAPQQLEQVAPDEAAGTGDEQPHR